VTSRHQQIRAETATEAEQTHSAVYKSGEANSQQSDMVMRVLKTDLMGAFCIDLKAIASS
jgi:hypothetical protein